MRLVQVDYDAGVVFWDVIPGLPGTNPATNLYCADNVMNLYLNSSEQGSKCRVAR